MKSGLILRAAMAGVLAWVMLSTQRLVADDVPAVPSVKQPASPSAGKEPATKPVRTAQRANSRKPAVAKVPAAFTAALTDLRREFQQGKLRSTSDYFTEKPSDEMTPDVVLSLLQRKHDREAAMDAYIKWQLLSALPAELPDQSGAELITAYLNAPAPERRPALSPDEKKFWDKELKHGQDSQDTVLQLRKEVAHVADLNAPVFDYRNALMAKMPQTFKGMEACLQDVFARAQAGADTQKAADETLKRIQKWAASASPKEINDMVSLLSRLQRQSLPTYYEGTKSDPDQGSRQRWEERSSGMGDIPKAIAFIERNQDSPAAGADNPVPKRSSRDSKRK